MPGMPDRYSARDCVRQTLKTMLPNWYDAPTVILHSSSRPARPGTPGTLTTLANVGHPIDTMDPIKHDQAPTRRGRSPHLSQTSPEFFSVWSMIIFH
ncbi:hypothetical protein BDV09DRAFT_163202 [Aspergillus tetrazonus]